MSHFGRIGKISFVKEKKYKTPLSEKKIFNQLLGKLRLSEVAFGLMIQPIIMVG